MKNVDNFNNVVKTYNFTVGNCEMKIIDSSESDYYQIGGDLGHLLIRKENFEEFLREINKFGNAASLLSKVKFI